jgi:hypothetical protein
LTNGTQARHERRAGIRISPKVTAILLAGDVAQRGRISNISTGGFLATTAVTAAEKVLGASVDIELRLDGQHSEWLRLSGRVVRIGPNTIAVAFGAVPAAFSRLIDEMSTASHGDQRVLSVVLVDATLERRLPMAEAFRAAGCAVIDVSTPLEAIVRLGESHFEPELIAIADSLPGSTSDELRQFVEREHPRAKLIAIGDDIVEPIGIANWLSAANPDDDLAPRIREILTRPRQA